MKNDTHGGTALAPRTGKRQDAADAWTFDGYEVHPLARHTPPLDEPRREALKRQIARCGPPPVLKHGEQILGDHNVCRACVELGVPIGFVEWDGDGSFGEAVALASVDPRQHDASVRAGLAVPYSEQFRAELQPRRYRFPGAVANAESNRKTAFSANGPETAQCAVSGKPQENDTSARRASELFQVSESAVYQARHLWKEHPDLYGQLLLGQLNLSQARLQASKRKRAATLPAVEDLRRKRARAAGDLDELIEGDCVAVMRRWLDGARSFDLIFADPPYNNGWRYDGDRTADRVPESAYLEFSEAWIRQCARLLSPTGSIFVMINDEWQDRLCMLLRRAGLHRRNTIVWHTNFSQNTDRSFVPSARYIHYFSKSPKQFTWNPDAVRVESERDRLGDARRVHERGVVPNDVWLGIPQLPGNSNDRPPFADMPPANPAPILERCILAASNPGDRVFDPFTGNGTTWRAARKLGRAFTGIERSPLYARQAEQWAMAEERRA